LVRPFSHPEVKLVLLLMVPRIIGLCADQVNSFVDQFCASFLPDGSITALYNSNRIMQLPLALFGVAVSTVALPALSRFASEKNDKEFKETLNFSLRISNYILIPSLVGLTVLALPIVQVLFQHGRFSLENSHMTVAALIPYVLGLPAYSAIKILATGFYALKNTRTPVMIALADMVLHVIMNIVFMRWFGVGGLALSTAISAWFQAGLLFYYLRKETGPLGGRGVVTSFLSGTLAGSLMGTVAALLSFNLLRDMPLAMNVSLSIAAGVGVFFLLSKLFKIREYQYFMNALLRRRLAE
jgi:putative peptidoglycan lipid II flippase